MKQVVVAGDISDERTLEAPGTRLRVKPEPVWPTSTNVPRNTRLETESAVVDQRWREVERAIGIEYIAGIP
jgi:hypothetical protein